MVALACERPADRAVPLRRYSLSELTVEVANRLPSEQVAPSRTAIWRLLTHDALRPRRYRSWIFPRDPHFLERAGPALDLYTCQWQGQPLWADEYVLSADEKTSIQVRRRLHLTLPIGPHQAMRVEHEYERAGVLQFTVRDSERSSFQYRRRADSEHVRAAGRQRGEIHRLSQWPTATGRCDRHVVPRSEQRWSTASRAGLRLCGQRL